MKKNQQMKSFFKTASIAIALGISTSANAALVERLGGLAYYDTEVDMTWLADANYAMTSGYHATGRMSWDQAMTWVSTLEVGGVGGWRLPDTVDLGSDGCNDSYSGTDCGFNVDPATGELANMFYRLLGGFPLYDTNGVYQYYVGLESQGPFSNVLNNAFWSAAEYEPYTLHAWYFDMATGFQGSDDKWNGHFAWAVHSGDVNPVPIPAAVWLFGSGLVGLAGIARGKQKQVA